VVEFPQPERDFKIEGKIPKKKAARVRAPPPTRSRVRRRMSFRSMTGLIKSINPDGSLR
jgi:hypothetical protein